MASIFSPNFKATFGCFKGCKGPEETVQHIFLGCSFAIILWRNIHWPIDTSSFSILPITHWIKARSNQASSFSFNSKRRSMDISNSGSRGYGPHLVFKESNHS